MLTAAIKRAALVLGSLALVASTASAQYFGRNKVQYKKLDFQILRTDHFDIYFYPSEREGVDVAARMAERWHARLERLLQHTLRGRQPLVLYASHPDFEQTSVIGGELGEGTGGVTEPLRRRIVLPMGGPLADTDHVIGHELVHAFQFDITSNPNSPPGENGAERLPLWFIEGMAEYLSLGPVDPNTAMWLRDAARQDKLPSIDDLDNPKYFPYRWGQAFWAYVGGRFGDDVIRRMLNTAAAAGNPDAAIERVLGVKTKELSSDWQASIRRTYEPILATTRPPSEVGRAVVKAGGLGTDLNIGPAISPDGRWLAFLSERTVFSTDLYVADAKTGKIVHRLTSTASDPHFSSIQFIYSAGGWDAASQRIAIATVVDGHPALAVFGAEQGDKQHEVSIPELDEIFNPSWAPDGHAIAFTGMVRGLTDLFVYDLTQSKLRRLTNDPYAELMPAWSPDGKRIAFATDRFSSNLANLSIGQYRLAVVDVDSGMVEPLRAFTDGKNINPQWSPDGRSLYFISDRDGISNLYRASMADGNVVRLTNVGTGVSGITGSSPALSVATGTGEAFFSVYENGQYSIYALDATSRGEALTLAPTGAATLPPPDRKTSEVSTELHNDNAGLPDPGTQYPASSYRPTLQLDGFAQPAIGVGTSRFGTAIGGGIAMQFSDMLANHVLATAVQASSYGGSFSAKDIGAQIAYFNQEHRLNWGVVGGQLPYLTGGFLSTLTPTAQGDMIETDQNIIYRQTELSAAGVVSYPFSRASRVEFQAGVTRISFDQIVQSTSFSLVTGAFLGDNTQTTALANPLTLGNVSAAYVSDTSSFGATSPVQGQRYRLEVTPSFGSLNFTSLLADYRRYFMPAPFYTIAARVIHYGRYGAAGDDLRLFPLFLGYPNLVRGYDVNTFDPSDCVPTATSDCPALDRLAGSRLLVGNLELRFPLLRPFGTSRQMYGPVPIELGLFTDAGVAWNSLTQPATQANNPLGLAVNPHPFNWRNGVASAGAAFRVNFFGFAVGEFDFSRPFQRPSRGWVFQFNLAPGF
jgi:Tol biopolymer transport system component